MEISMKLKYMESMKIYKIILLLFILTTIPIPALGYFTSSPIVDTDGNVYAGHENFKFYSINSTGSENWNYTTGGKIYSTPLMDTNGNIYFGSDDGKLYALSSSGSLLWSYNTTGKIRSSPNLDYSNALIYVGSDSGYLYALNYDGTLNWTRLIDSTSYAEVYSSPAIDTTDNVVYIGSRYMNKLMAFYPNGSSVWNFSTPDYMIRSSPAIDSNRSIYIAASNGKLYKIYLNGQEAWNVTLIGGDPSKSSPAIDNWFGMIYIGAGQYLNAIYPNGTIRWFYKTDGIISSSPAIGAGSSIYFSSEDGYSYSLNLDGTLNWKDYGYSAYPNSPAIDLNGNVYFVNKYITKYPSIFYYYSPSGYVTNYSNASIENANVTLFNSTFSVSNFTNSSGWFDLTGQLSDGFYNLSVTKTGYQTVNSYVYIDNSGLILLNVSMISGLVGGIVVYANHSNGTYDYVTEATVTITQDNTTWNTTTDTYGGFIFNDVSLGTYTLNISKTGYENYTTTVTINESKMYSYEYYILTRLYTLTVKASDAVTDSYLGSFTVSVSNHSNISTTTGAAVFYVNASNYTVYVSAGGYYPLSGTFFIYQDTEITFPLYPYIGGVELKRHNVRFAVQDIFGNPQIGVNITAIDVRNPSLINFTGLTGTDGTLTFFMDSSVYYNITFRRTDINVTWYLYPKEDYYLLIINSITNQNSICGNIYFNLTNSYVNTTYNQLGLTYSDSSNSTTLINFYVKYSNGTYIYSSSAINTSLWYPYFNVNSSKGNVYFWGFNATVPSCNLIEQTKVIECKGTGRFIDLHIDDAWYQWLSILGIGFIAALFSVRKVKFAAVVVPFSAGMFSYFGWFTINPILLGSAIVIGILIYLRMSEVKVNY